MNEEKLSAENVGIADYLIRLTHNQRNWGFCLYLRNVNAKHTTILPPNFSPISATLLVIPNLMACHLVAYKLHLFP
jgi:putative transposase